MYWQLNKSAAQKHIKSAERQPLHSHLYWPSCQRRSAQQRVSITTIASFLVAGLSLTYHDHTAAKATLIRLILNRAMKLRPVGGAGLVKAEAPGFVSLTQIIPLKKLYQR